KKRKARLARKSRIRKSIHGSAERPRLAIFRSAKYIYAQVIDDLSGKTLAACSSLEKDIKGKVKSTRSIECAKTVGQELASRAKKANVSTVVFDRSGFVYHGRVAALAEGAREAGLKF